MASLVKDQSGNFLVAFRWERRQFTRSLDTRDQETAAIAVARVDETIMRLKRGWLEVPAGVEVGKFIASGGAAKPSADGAAPILTGDLFDRFASDIPLSAKEATTRTTERIHRDHLRRLLGGSVPVESITLAGAQQYAAARMAETYRGAAIQAETAIKELRTFRKIWAWGIKVGLVKRPCPWTLADLQIGKVQGRDPFRTFAEIERRIARGGMTAEEEEKLWECLYLTEPELDEMLAYVEANASAPFIFPLTATSTFTGMRRSELCRCLVDDVDWEHHWGHFYILTQSAQAG